jgi:hypothetical protein
MSERSPIDQPVVWVVNNAGHDMSAAERFGRLMPLTTGSVNPFNVDRLMANIAPRLQHAQEEDYVLISGLPLLNAVVLLLWLAKFPHVKLLQYSVKRRGYTYIHLTRAAVEKNATGDGRPA